MLRRSSLIALLLLCACPKPAPEADEFIVNCEGAATGTAVTSDESFTSFIEAEAAGRAVKDPCKSPELLSPTVGPLDRSTPPIFSFRPSHASCALPVRSPGALGCRARPQRPSAAAVLGELARSLVEGTAYAHCAAVTGENYLFRIHFGDADEPAYTAMLSVTSFTPDRAIWERAISSHAGQTAQLTIERGVFLRGDLNEGPYVQSEPYTLTVSN